MRVAKLRRLFLFTPFYGSTAGSIGWVLCFALCTTVSPTSAQVSWEIGVKGGIGLSRLTGDTRLHLVLPPVGGVGSVTLDANINEFRTGLAAGIFGTARIHRNFGIRLELLYTEKGGEGNVAATYEDASQRISKSVYELDYVEIPLLAVGTVPAGQYAAIHVFGGPSLGFNVESREKFKTAQGEQSRDLDGKTDFGLTVGTGVSLRAHEKARIIIDARWTFGLTSFYDPFLLGDLRNTGLAIMAGVSFPIGGSIGP